MRELTKGLGSDGRKYAVVPMSWSIAKVEEYWSQMAQFPIFSDGMEKTSEGFMNFILTSGAVWFELVDVELDLVFGLMYLTDMHASTKGTIIEATWHGMVWDTKAGPRRPIAKSAIVALFKQFGLHRLRVEIPVHFAGVIRQAEKIGFVLEGRIREAKQYNGRWYDALVMSILESEVIGE